MYILHGLHVFFGALLPIATRSFTSSALRPGISPPLPKNKTCALHATIRTAIRIRRLGCRSGVCSANRDDGCSGYGYTAQQRPRAPPETDRAAARAHQPPSRPASVAMSSFDQPMPPFNASDPSASFLSSSCLDLLLIEIVPMAYRVANEVDAAASSSSGGPEEPKKTGGGGDGATVTSPPPDAGGRRRGASPVGPGHLDEDEERDAVFCRLESLGYRVGLGLVERYVTSPLDEHEERREGEKGTPLLLPVTDFL